MEKDNKNSVIAMLIIFLGLNGVAIYFLSLFLDMKFLKMYIAFLVVVAVIDGGKRIRNYLIIRKLKAEHKKQMEKLNEMRRQEIERKKELKKQALATQQARIERIRRANKSKSKK